MALPRALPDAVGKVGHLVEDSVYLRYHIFAFYGKRRPAWCPQRYVQNRPVLRDIYLLTTKHGVDSLPQAGFLSQLNEEFERFIGNAIFRIIQTNACCLGGHTLAAFWVIGEKRAKMQWLYCLAVRLKGIPGRTFCERFYGCCHVHHPPPLSSGQKSNDQLSMSNYQLVFFHIIVHS